MATNSKKKLTLLGLLGDRIETDLSTILALLCRRNAVVFFGMVAVVLFASDLSSVRTAAGWAGAAVVWPAAVVLYLAFYVALINGAALAQSRWPRLMTPMPLIGGLALVPTVYIADHLVLFLASGNYVTDWAGKLIYYYLASQAFETIFIRFVFPQMTQSAPEPEKPEEEPDRSILVAGEKLSVGRLRYIEARQHLVDIRLDGRKVTHRARLSDIIAQTDLNDGMQPHRSWWVSANSEPRLIRDGARYMLKLADDTTIPVARGRVAEVQAWLDAGHSNRESAN